MRRYVATFAVALMPFAVTACEDGPNQTYSPAPPNAGNIWNGSPGAGGLGDGGAYVPGATDGYDASFGGQNANDLCTADQEKKIWTALFQAPIEPPGLGAGIDIAGGPNGDGNSGFLPGKPFNFDPTKETWTGVTVEQAEKILCQATASSIFYGVTNTVGWGEQLEVNALYNTNNRQIQQLIFGFGYVGPMSGTDKEGNTWSVPLNNNLMTETNKQGQTTQILLNWASPSSLVPIYNGLYEALRNTYIPNFPPDPNNTCAAAGHCIIGNNGTGGGYFFFVPMNLAIYVNTTVGTEVANSTPGLIQLGKLKLLPFSIANNLMKLDSTGEGPTSTTPDVQGLASNDPNIGATTTCKYTLGMTFKDFDAQCVQVFNATTNPSNYMASNIIAEHKLLGAVAHSDEAYQFDIVGVDPQFAAASLDPHKVLGDTDTPQPADIAYQLELDQNILGFISNDYPNNDPTTGAKDLHGLGMLSLEWANLVQHYMQKAYGVTTELGDPNCLAPNSAAKPGGGAGVKCSGIEGIVTTAPTSLAVCPAAGTAWPSGSISTCTSPTQMKVNALGTLATQQIAAAAPMAQGLQPGTWYQVFCNDAGGVSGGALQGYQDCWGGTAPFDGAAAYYFDSMQDGVLASGNWGQTLGQLPSRDLGSRRFFFQQWILAAIKYLQSAGNPNATLQEIDANPVDPNELFFDSNGGGFESGEYVFRNTVNSANQAPTDLQITTNLTTAVINDWTFGRYNFRGEKALYTVLDQNPGTDLPGAENLYLSNIVGSPLLATTYGSYACAINLDPNNAACTASGKKVAVTGPTDPLGNPLLTGYAPAFGASVFNIAALNGNVNTAPFTVDTVGPASGPYQLIEQAMITLPIWSNPFDPTTATANDKTISVLLPYLPKGSGVGFPVTIDGSRDKFYNTNQLTFTGETLDAVLDYEEVPVSGADGGVTTANVVRAIESQNYLGLAFACVETGANGQPDVLAVRMYENENDVLAYLATYPTATTDCAIQIKYSPYGNYADYISSLQYGVRLGFNPGFGGSVVSDLTLFDPNVVSTLGQ